MDSEDAKFAESLEMPKLKKKKKISQNTICSAVAFGVLCLATVLTVTVVFHQVLPKATTYPWWVNKPIYRILVESFQDSDGDGLGDLHGITQRLDYIQSIGVGSIWLSNILESEPSRLTLSLPKRTVLVKNFTAIEAVLGNFEELAELTREAAKRDVVVAMDVNPLWTSIYHYWFLASRNRVSQYENYYVWSNSTDNLTSSEYGWQFDKKRNEYYLYQIKPQIAVINLNNVAVREDMKNVFRFWIDLGVNAFNIGPVSQYMRDPFSTTDCSRQEELEEYLWDTCNGRIVAAGLWKDFIHQMGATVFGYWDVDDNGVTQSVLGLAGNVDFTVNLRMEYYLDFDYSGNAITQSIMSWVTMVSAYKAVWMFGDEYYSRVASHAGSRRIEINFAFELLFPGGSAIYYGEELGLPNNNNVSSDAEVSRTPMLWSLEPSSGFSINKQPWLPVHAFYETLCVQTQLNSNNTYLKKYLKLNQLREEYRGKEYFTALLDTYVAISRWKFLESDAILVLVNFSHRALFINMQLHSLEYETMGVILVAGMESKYRENDEVDLRHLEIYPDDMLVIQYYPATNGLEVSEGK